MEHHSLTSLVIVIVIAFITPILMNRLKLTILPVVVAEILMGLIIGKSGLNLVMENDMWLETLSTLGFIFLMFLSGLEIDFSSFRNGKNKKKQDGQSEPNTFTVSSIVFLGIFALSLLLSYLFVWMGFINQAFLMTIIISTISLGVVVPTLKEERIMNSSFGQIILLVAVIADLVTMVLLAIFASIYEEGNSNMWLLLILFAAGVILYFFGRGFKNRRFVETMSKGTIQIGTRAVFTLIIVLVALSETVGAENILGAFLAGVLVSLLSPNKEMVEQLDSFGYGFLIPIFFVMVGAKLDLWSLFQNPKILALIPLLFIALLISKLLPVMLLKKWFGTRQALAAGFLLTSTLSLVIAAATIGERLGLIDSQMSGALILVAVITSIITPIGFKKLYIKKSAKEQKRKIAFIGATQMTLPVTLELNPDRYEVRVYHVYPENAEEKISDSVFDIHRLPDYKESTLRDHSIYEADIIVVATGDESLNSQIASFAKENGVNRVIASTGFLSEVNELTDKGIEPFSIPLSGQMLLKAYIEAPEILNVLSGKDASLAQINMKNKSYDGVMLRNFPFKGDLVFVRIFRGSDSIIPHGDTVLKTNDRLIISGSRNYINDLRSQLEVY